MADAAAAVLARLKNKANESGRTYQLCLQLFCQEEFLRRLEKSKYVDNLVLKGGLFIYAITDFDSRVTMDVDFLLWKVPNTPEQLKTVLEEIITVPAGNDFVTYEIKGIAPIAVTKKYAGIGASLVARIKNIRTPLNIDFSVGDMIVPKQEKRKIPTQLEDFTAPMINTYSLETTVAEKIDAILNLMEFSSRRYIPMAKKKVEEKINLDSILFKCRDILRKARNSGSFFEKRDMMLTLVFLRFIGEKFEDGVENLRKNLIREGLDPDDEAIKAAFLDDPTFTDGTYNLPMDARWSTIIETPAPKLNVALDTALHSIAASSKQLKGCFVEGTFTTRNLAPNDIKQVVDEVNKISHKAFGEEKDLIGRVYEYFFSILIEMSGIVRRAIALGGVPQRCFRGMHCVKWS